MYDVIIIGAGPAGLTSAIYTSRAGLKTLVLEKESIGGKMASAPLLENYPGFKEITGSDLANKMYEQVISLGAKVELEEVVLIKDGVEKKIITNENTYETKTIIIASGSKYRLLNLPNEEKLIGNGIHFCTTCDGSFYKNKIVGVVGGANSAISNALYLATICQKIYLIVRKDKLKGEQKLIEEVLKKDNIEIIYKTTITKLNGDDELENIELNNKDILKIDGLFISTGMDAENDFAKDLINLTKDFYVDSINCQTNIKGIFAAGDCRDKKIRQITTATSDGTICAMEAIEYLKGT